MDNWMEEEYRKGRITGMRVNGKKEKEMEWEQK